MMHSVTGIVGGVVLAGVALLATDPLFSDPKPIEVHQLYYDAAAGQMVQERTVTTDGEFFWAHWQAQVIDASTDEIVCEGEGGWPYKAGRITARMDIPKWVGDPGCDLPPGTYRLRAAWLWGDDQESETGPPFTIE